MLKIALVPVLLSLPFVVGASQNSTAQSGSTKLHAQRANTQSTLSVKKTINGIKPRYEPINPKINRNYRMKTQHYKIVQNTARFSQTGIATWYGKKHAGKRTALGEKFNAQSFTAAHPTLPIPSYARVTNLANGRQVIVRINDRGPFANNRIIDLSRSSANALNMRGRALVRVDCIKVAPDGTLSGPGAI